MLAARRSLWRQAATVATPVVSGGIHHAPVRNLPPFLMRGNASAPPFSTMVLIANAQCPAMRVLVPKNSAAAFKNSTKYSKRSPLTTRFSTSSPSSPAGSNSGSQKVVAVVEKSMTQFERLKDLWRKYGIVAIGTYFSMYGIVLGSIYLAIDQGWVSTSKPSRSDSEDPENSEFNVVTATNKFVTLAEDLGIAKYLEVEHVNAKTGTFLIAWVATKFTEPVRLAVTLAITPRIARFLRRAPKIQPKP